MRITLMHNPGAGRGEHKADDLMALLVKAGHEATYQSMDDKDYKDALDRPTDTVVAAGGDGTVGKVARHLVGRGIPLSVLPLGTANNLARTLGFTGSPAKLIGQLADAERRNFDVGRATGPWGERYFFEGVGAGLLPDFFRELASSVKEQEDAESISKKEEITRDVALLRRLLPAYSAREWQLGLDGEDVSGRYLLWEAMNIRSVGPVLTLAPQAETVDGQFDFVAVPESDRSLLADHLAARLEGNAIAFPLPARRFRHLRVVWEGATLHFDDELWPRENEEPESSSEIEIAVEASALTVLLPAEGARHWSLPFAGSL